DYYCQVWDLGSVHDVF
nr:immunoglobulin light chain junction region [Macaca mulatta]MOV94295.1 immunoglobulin light chain junction region [Macaca mulatta]MOV94321.1 immunoglobulin light chain junction region [Macaca mulatta]MOV94336.1 immunoglobulin light chain junction region [Macaca mulatta]MOV94411.1 immunoglobulin light chain junction region [Macaca mulatta]